MASRRLSRIHSRVAAFLICLLLLVPMAACAGGARQPTSAAAQQAFTFAVIGDMGYSADQEPLVDNLLAAVNAAPLELVVHVGDLGGPSTGSCTDEHWAHRLTQFRASSHPLIYTPGDNDWVDCWEERAGSYDALERLDSLRDRFFPDEQSLGQRTLPLIRQSATPGYPQFRENARWSHGSVTFMTVHYVTEVLGRTTETDAEFEARNRANVAWLTEGFRSARDTDSRGVVVLTQANLFPDYAAGRGVPPQPRQWFEEFWSQLEQETSLYGKPVLLAHGDTHYFRVDYPLHSSAPECLEGTYDVRPLYCRFHNLTRVESFGAPFHHWVEVTVDPSDPTLFTVRPRLVEANMPDLRPE
jgi:hypothetical protein